MLRRRKGMANQTATFDTHRQIQFPLLHAAMFEPLKKRQLASININQLKSGFFYPLYYADQRRWNRTKTYAREGSCLQLDLRKVAENATLSFCQGATVDVRFRLGFALIVSAG